MAETQNILKGSPVKAFMHQDHEAHIRFHMATMQDPIIMQILGQNPRAPMIQAALTAHIAEHVGYAYRQKVEQQLGMPLPPEDEKLPPQVEIGLSAMMAQAANQVLMQNKAMAAQQQAQQNAQDPIVQMQMQELQLKTKELELKERQLAMQAATKADELDLKREELSGKMQLEGMRVGAQINESKTKIEAQQMREGVRMGIDVAKAKAQERLAMLKPPAGGKR
jgi:hypothetical protein